MSDDIPDFLRLTTAQRKAAWEASPPTVTLQRGWRTPEQEAAEKARLQQLSDERRLQRCLSKQKRIVREQLQTAKLEDKSRSAQGHTWDVRTARWIDPIEAALQERSKEEKKVMAPKKTEKKVKTNSVFGFRPNTNYSRLMDYLLAHKGQLVPVKDLAKEAYGNAKDLEKHCMRVVTMARKVQEKIIKPQQLPFNIVKERKENVLSIGLFAK